MENDFESYDEAVEHNDDNVDFGDAKQYTEEDAAGEEQFQDVEDDQYQQDEYQESAEEAMVQSLEKQMNVDPVAHALGNMEEHHSQMMESRGSMSNLLAGTAKELEVRFQLYKTIKADSLTDLLLRSTV
jgi:hypothetical protein